MHISYYMLNIRYIYKYQMYFNLLPRHIFTLHASFHVLAGLFYLDGSCEASATFCQAISTLASFDAPSWPDLWPCRSCLRPCTCGKIEHCKALFS